MRRWRAGLLSAVAVVAVAGSLMAAEPTSSQAAVASDFDPGYIISDDIFFDGDAMSVAEIHAFLESKAPSCATGGTCIDTFRITTSDREADSFCAGYTGAANESSATILAKVGLSCGINPQVLLVLLQKEQGLLTYRSTVSNPNVNDSRYKKATGYACPDTAPCDARYYGFQNQVYSAARQFKRYTASPNNWSYGVGSNVIAYHPSTYWSPPRCGSVTVNIRNQATANLYIYTPYVPNASALANMYGEGDNCASYGNRNFWRYFTDWFGSPTSKPFGRVDNSSVSLTSVTLSGWAIDPDTPASIRVHVYVDGSYFAGFTANGERPDVGAAYPGSGDFHGYRVTVEPPVGDREVCVWAVNVGPGTSTKLGCISARIFGENPLGRVDSIIAGIGTAQVSGWALDPDGEDPVTVDIEIDGVAVGSTVADRQRPDVGDVYPFGDSRGYLVTVPVTKPRSTVCAIARNAGAGDDTSLGCRTVDVLMGDPIGRFDSVRMMGTTATIRGWAIDPDTSDPIRYHVYVDGAFHSVAYADQARADVADAYPAYGENHAYTTTATLASGQRQVCVYGINAGVGSNALIGCRAVTVGSGDPFGRLDSLTSEGLLVTARGWAVDPDSSDSIRYHVYVNGSYFAGGVAANERADVGVAYPGYGAAHGYAMEFTLEAGQHEVCTYGISVLGGRNALLACKTVVTTD